MTKIYLTKHNSRYNLIVMESKHLFDNITFPIKNIKINAEIFIICITYVLEVTVVMVVVLLCPVHEVNMDRI